MSDHPSVYPRALVILVVLLCLVPFAPVAQAEQAYQRVQVTDPYIEMRTGPGRGFPVFYVGERGEWIELMLRKTDWFKVRLANGKVGWVTRTQLESTLTEAGVNKTFRDVLVDDYLKRRAEFGVGAGSFEGDTILNFRLGYLLTDTLSLELTYSQISGTFSGSTLYQFNLQAQPYAGKRLSPFFTIGVGQLNNIPKATLVGGVTTDSTAANVGLGVRYYLTRRFLARLDYTDYLVFIGDNRTENYQSFTGGFSFFF